MKSFFFAWFSALIVSTGRAVASEKGMPQLDPEFWAAQIFWLILIFSILYIIIWKIFLPRIVVGVENRKSRIVNDLDEAQKLEEKAKNKLDEYNKIIQAAEKEAKKIIEHNKKKLKNDIEEKKIKFNEEIEKELYQVEKEIKNLKKNSVESVNKIAVEIASEIIKKIVGTEVNKSNVSAIVEDFSKRKAENF